MSGVRNGSRSLIKNLNDTSFQIYSKLFQACVCVVLDYAAGVCDLRNISLWEFALYSAIYLYIIYLGVHKYAPKLAILGDMGWEPCEGHWKICIAQLWARLTDMDENRLTRKILPAIKK